MPIYEYKCPDCGHQFELLQKISADPPTDCPECAATNVKKLISPSAFVLKGGGWYKDHYGLKSGSSDKSSDSSGASDSASSSSSGDSGSSGSSSDSASSSSSSDSTSTD